MEPIVQLICHCRDCQRASGSAFAAIMTLAADRFRFPVGEPAYHEVTGGSGRKLHRGFCAKCGSPLTLRWPEWSAVQLIQVASLDDPSCFEPQTELWMARGIPGTPCFRNNLKFEERPLSGVKDCLDAYFADRAKPGSDAR